MADEAAAHADAGPADARFTHSAPVGRRRGLSGKALLILVTVVAGGLVLLASTRVWIDIDFVAGSAAVERTTVTGQKLNPAVALVAIAAIAAALVLTIAGRVFRRVVGALIALLGAGLVVVGVAVLSSPVSGARQRIGELTGITGEAQASLVSAVRVSMWPTIVVALGAVLALVGVLVVVLGGRWRSAGRRYEAAGESTRSRAPRSTGENDRISDWDALSGGDDPTSSDP